MALALSTLVNGVRNGRTDLAKPKLTDKAAQLTDLALVISTVTIGILLTVGVMSLGLSGPLAAGLQLGLIGLGVSIIVVDAGMWMARALLNKSSRQDLTSNKSSRQDLTKIQIQQIASTNPTLKDENANFNRIAGELYLGNGVAAMSCSDLAVSINNKSMEQICNPQKFKVVITVCPVSSAAGDLDIPPSESVFSTSLQDQGVTWHYVGATMFDTETSEDGSIQLFQVLAHDCTFLHSELSQFSMENLPKQEKKQKVLSALKDKAEKMKKTPTSEWFEPIFLTIDSAIKEDVKTLVHCKEGVSRSATLLAAYLINRYQVSAEEAVTFLRAKRRCVDPHFMESLENYAKALENERSAGEGSSNL